MAAMVARLITCRSGNRIGLPDMLPLSLRKAITEPEKVIAPMATPRPISIRLTGRMLTIDGLAIGVIRTAIPNASGFR